MLVVSCDDVPTNPVPATGRQVGVDVGIVSFGTTSDGQHIDNPRWGRASAERLAEAQRRLARARRGARNRAAKRETVAARHRKDFIVRSFLYEPQEMQWFREGYDKTGLHVMVQTKCEPHDWDPFYPNDPLIGDKARNTMDEGISAAPASAAE